MTRQKDQILMFNDVELALIKNTFAENEELLYAIRKVLLQFPLSASEKALVKGSMNAEVFAVVKKRIYPELDSEIPFGQIGDIYQTITKDLLAKGVDDMAPLFDAKQIEIEYLEQQFEFLKDVNVKIKPIIKLDALALLVGKTPYQRYVDTMARNFILGYIDPMLVLLRNIAGTKKETPEELKKRLTRDSSK